MGDHELMVPLSCTSSTLAKEFTVNAAAGNRVSKFLGKLEQVDDVCAQSVCQALHKSWDSILSKYSVLSNPDASDWCSESTANPPVEGAASLTESSIPWAQIALDFSWSKLNGGYWKDVPLVWREAYATAALFKAIGLLSVGRLQESLSEIDKGILLGAPVFCNVLQRFASTLTREIKEIEQISSFDDISNSHVNICQKQQVLEGHCSTNGMDNSGIGKVVFKNYSSYQKSSSHCVVETSITGQLHDDGGSSLCTDLSIVPLLDMTRRIAVDNCPSLEEFYQKYMMNSTPVVISGAMDHWPAYATKKWRYSHAIQVPYSCIIRRMRLYLQRKRMCA